MTRENIVIDGVCDGIWYLEAFYDGVRIIMGEKPVNDAKYERKVKRLLIIIKIRSTKRSCEHRIIDGDI